MKSYSWRAPLSILASFARCVLAAVRVSIAGLCVHVGCEISQRALPAQPGLGSLPRIIAGMACVGASFIGTLHLRVTMSSHFIIWTKLPSAYDNDRLPNFTLQDPWTKGRKGKR